MTEKTIYERRGMLEKERREFRQKAMTEFDKEHYRKLRALQNECETAIGHHWRFTHLGPLGHPWFSCTFCGASRVESED